MSNEVINVWGTQKVLEANGASMTSLSLAAATNTYSVETDGSSFPDAEFTLTVSFTTAPAAQPIMLYARPLDIDGTLDAEVPEAGFPRVLIGYFMVRAITGTQTITLSPTGFARDVPRKAEYWLYNNNTGQTIQAGWTLKVTPRTTKAAA